MSIRAAIRASLGLLDRRDRRLLALATAVKMTSSLLDLFGVVLLGAVGALAVSAGNAGPPPRPVASALAALGLDGWSSGSVIGVLAGAAAALLLIKSMLSPFLMSRVFRFLGRREAAVSAHLTQALLAQPLTFVQRRSSQQTASALMQCANAATVQVLGQSVLAAGEVALLTLLAVVLILVNPPVAFGAIAFFAAFAATLQKILGQRTADHAVQRRSADVASLVAVQEALGAYREITVANRRSFYVDRIKTLREQAAQSAVDSQLLGMTTKYVSEAALVVGASALAGALFSTEPIPLAAGTFAMFLAAATRIMPALLRLQNALLSIRSAGGWATPTFELAADLESRFPVTVNADPVTGPDPTDFVPCIDVSDVTFSYAEHTPALRGVSMAISAGQSVALVGRSGAGKSTLADVILGVLEPQCGTVAVGGVAPDDAVRRWPGSIAYVPQDVMLANDTLRANVALGIHRELVDDQQVWDALRRAHLENYLRNQAGGLDSVIGERGLRLSGGQRQRLGIARALYTRPRLLVLDEATSALDAETEEAITATLADLAEDVTTVVIAHRLSTVRNADLVVYLDEGRAAAVGTFDEVCARVPALQRQATLMGLRPG
jgi:ABC-type multidrug transport system fused ATPase/permease subunit